MEREVDNQVAAPAETRTPNWHRAKQSLIESADGRVATVVARREKNLVQQGKNKRIDLTPTGLLMEGDFTSLRRLFALSPRILSVIGIYRLSFGI